MTKALELAKFGRESAPTGLVVGDSDAQTLSQKTFSDMPTFSSGTTNGVAYLNASKVLTTASGLVFDGTNFGVGTSSPMAKLHVAVAGDNETVIARFAVTSSGGVPSSLKVLADPAASLVKFDAIGAVSNGYQFLTGGTFRAQLTSSGYLSLGTTNATEVLTVSNSNYEALGLYRNVDYNSVGANGVRLYLGGYVDSTPTRTAYLDATMMTATTSRLGLGVLISGTLTESLRIDTNGSVRIGGTFAAISASAEKLTVDGGTSQATTLANTSDSYGTVYIKNRSNTAATIQPYLYFNDVDGGNRSGFGVKYTDASLHHFAQGGINWYTGSAGFSGLRATLNATGLGIGTASPATALHVYATDTSANRTSTYNAATITAYSAQAPYTGFGPSLVFASQAYNSGIVNSTRITSEINNDSIVNYGGSLGFDVTATVGGSLYRAMTIRYNGYVGIGTNTPAVEFEARGRARVGDGTNTLTSGYWDGVSNRIESVGKPLFLTSYNDSIRFGISGSENMRIASGGQVVINDTSAQYGSRLYVNGSIAARHGGVDGTYADAFIAGYTSNYNEKNIIQTAVSSAGTGSGFRFKASDGAGLASTSNVLDLTRSETRFYTSNTERAKIDVNGKTTFWGRTDVYGQVNRINANQFEACHITRYYPSASTSRILRYNTWYWGAASYKLEIWTWNYTSFQGYGEFILYGHTNGANPGVGVYTVHNNGVPVPYFGSIIFQDTGTTTNSGNNSQGYAELFMDTSAYWRYAIRITSGGNEIYPISEFTWTTNVLWVYPDESA